MGDKKSFAALNMVLIGVINQALFYLVNHDLHYKRYCLQTAAWDGVKRLRELALSLSEPFKTPVDVCLSECTDAMEKMPELNIKFEDFPVAAKSFIRLAEQIDQILKSDSSLREDVNNDDLASHRKYVNLEKLAVASQTQ